MKIEEVIKKIISLPKDHYELGNISEYDLLKKSGYFKIQQEISEHDIYLQLLKYPENIEFWFILSEDNRSSPTWCIVEESPSFYKVKYTVVNPMFSTVEFNDKTQACAAFIRRYLDSM